MGGVTNAIWGKSKIDVYLQYAELTEDWDGSAHPDPKCKKYCKSQMIQDPNTGEWVLRYHLHT